MFSRKRHSSNDDYHRQKIARRNDYEYEYREERRDRRDPRPPAHRRTSHRASHHVSHHASHLISHRTSRRTSPRTTHNFLRSSKSNVQVRSKSPDLSVEERLCRLETNQTNNRRDINRLDRDNSSVHLLIKNVKLPIIAGENVSKLNAEKLNELDECDLLLERRKMNEHSSSLYEQIRTIYDNANENAQIIMVSATLEDAVESKCLELVKKDHFAHFKTASSAPNKRVELRFIAKSQISGTSIYMMLSSLTSLKSTEKTFASQGIIFANASHGINVCCYALENDGIGVAPLHITVRQDVREEALTLFRRRKIGALVLSDSGSRGMNFECVNMVYMYDMPHDVRTFIHRVGRTGRRKAGVAVCLVDDKDEKILLDIKKVLTSNGRDIPASLDEVLQTIQARRI